MKIYTVTTDDENGTRVSVFTDRTEADNAAHIFMHRNWDRAYMGTYPVSAADALRAYNSHDQENLIWYEVHEVGCGQDAEADFKAYKSTPYEADFIAKHEALHAKYPAPREVWIVKGQVTCTDAHPSAKLGDVEWQFSDGPPDKRGSSADYLSLADGLRDHSGSVFHWVTDAPKYVPARAKTRYVITTAFEAPQYFSTTVEAGSLEELATILRASASGDCEEPQCFAGGEFEWEEGHRVCQIETEEGETLAEDIQIACDRPFQHEIRTLKGVLSQLKDQMGT